MASSASAQTLAAQAEAAAPAIADRWTGYKAFVLAVCIFGWAFDIVESTIPQIATPLLLQEWGITPAEFGWLSTIVRWIGLIGFFIFPTLADLYGRKSMLLVTIAMYSVLTGITGFVQNAGQWAVTSSATRLAISGENPVGQVMVVETAPTKWRATALGGLVGGYPFGYMLAALAGFLVVPLWGWRGLYFLGIIPAILVLIVRRGLKESPRFERVTLAMIREGLKQRLDIVAPIKSYPREMLIGCLLNFCYLWTWLGWSAFLPLFLANEKKLGFQTMTTYLTIWMAVAIGAYWLAGYLCDRFGRRFVIPCFVVPAGIMLIVIGGINDGMTLFWFGLVLNFLITGSFGVGLGYAAELFPTTIRGTAVGAIFIIGGVFSTFSITMMGYFATNSTIGAGLPFLALSFFIIAPIFLFFAKEVTRQGLTDFVGQKIGV